jgi:hypothetical protein
MCLQYQGSAKGLDTATTCHREALNLRPVGHSDQSTSLCNPANVLFTRFEQKLFRREVAETGTVVSGK